MRGWPVFPLLLAVTLPGTWSLRIKGDGPKQDLVLPKCVEQAFSKYSAPVGTDVDGIGNFFVLHYSKLAPRREFGEGQLALAGLKASTTYVTWFDKEVLGDDTDLRKCMIDPAFEGEAGLASISVKHAWAYYHTWRNNLSHVVVMEDDFVFTDAENLNSNLRGLLKSLPSDYKVVHLSGCQNMHGKKNKISEHLYGPGYDSRCAVGYMISAAGARAMLQRIFVELKRLTLPPDRQQDGVYTGAGYYYEPYLWETSTPGGRPDPPAPGKGPAWSRGTHRAAAPMLRMLEVILRRLTRQGGRGL